MAKLIFIGEKFVGRVYELAIEKTTVGRGDHNTLTIHDPSVSHSHCEILVYGTEVIVRDLGSSNGTVVDGRRLQDQQQHPLDDRQIVKFGAVEARLELSTESESDTVTGLTGFHAHARLVSEPNKHKPATEVVNPKTSPAAAADENTLLLPRPPETAKPEPPPKPVVKAEIAEPPRTTQFAFVITAIAIGLVIICWLILVRNR